MKVIDTEDHQYKYDRDPDICPICHHGIEPKRIGLNYIESTSLLNNRALQIFFRCPRQDCQQAFIGTYWPQYSRKGSSNYFTLENLSPIRPRDPIVSDQIQDLSPDFINLLGQSIAAECHGLDQIAGAGYRKALEFLIKDFAIFCNPDEAEKIKATFLGTCITNYIDDPKTKECAQRAYWLGNDETHYVRKWLDKDISDLKILLKLTQNWITNYLLTQEYFSSMDTLRK